MDDRFAEEPSNVSNFSQRLPDDVVPKMIASARSLFRATPPQSPSSLPKSSKLVSTWQRDFNRRIPTDGRAHDSVSKASKAGSGESVFELSANAPPAINLDAPAEE